MKASYEISRKSIDHLGRNNWEPIKTTQNKNKAIEIAKAQSKICLETEVRGIDLEGDVIFHAYYRDGALEIDMSV